MRGSAAPLAGVAALAFGAGTAYRLLASGSLTLDLGVGRRLQPLGPLVQTIAASAEIVFDVVAGPTSAALRVRCRRNSRSGSGAATWRSPPTSRR